MRKYIILLNSKDDMSYVFEKLRRLNSDKYPLIIVAHANKMIRIETNIPIGYIESIAGVKIVEEEVLHYKS